MNIDPENKEQEQNLDLTENANSNSDNTSSQEGIYNCEYDNWYSE